jgi:hypothetical protein
MSAMGGKLTFAKAAEPGHIPGMLTRPKIALYLLVAAIAATIVLYVVPLAWGLLIWTGWVGH